MPFNYNYALTIVPTEMTIQLPDVTSVLKNLNSLVTAHTFDRQLVHRYFNGDSLAEDIFKHYAAQFTLEKIRVGERPARVNPEAARRASLKYYYKIKSDPETHSKLKAQRREASRRYRAKKRAELKA